MFLTIAVALSKLCPYLAFDPAETADFNDRTSFEQARGIAAQFTWIDNSKLKGEDTGKIVTAFLTVAMALNDVTSPLQRHTKTGFGTLGKEWNNKHGTLHPAVSHRFNSHLGSKGINLFLLYRCNVLEGHGSMKKIIFGRDCSPKSGTDFSVRPVQSKVLPKMGVTSISSTTSYNTRSFCCHCNA